MPCLLQRGYEKKSWAYFGISKQNRGKNKPLPNTTQTQLKQKIFFASRAISFMSKCQSLKVTSVIVTEDGFKTGDDNRRISST